MKLQAAILTVFTIVSLHSNAFECSLREFNKKTNQLTHVKLKEIASDRAHILMTAETKEFSAVYELSYLTNTETLGLSDADAVIAKTEITMGTDQKLKLQLSRNKVFAQVECLR